MIAALLVPPTVISPFIADILLSCLAAPGSLAAYIGGARIPTRRTGGDMGCNCDGRHWRDGFDI